MVFDRLGLAVGSSALVERALRVATAAHGGPGHGRKTVAHPAAVADLIASRGFEEDVVAAALLHDTVEDTPLTIERIEAGFGKEVAGLVAGVTEDARIHPYAARKAEARSRMMRDPRTAAIYAADKLASVRGLLESGAPIDGERLEHFTRTLGLLSDGRPDLPFLPELAAAMAALIDRESAAPAPIGSQLLTDGREPGPAA
ncbi:MAG: bifunctional (p)ppGpp synthetase/guanosine-3',5'-bis(diphosphate) 3'-pyrophosphohydrolase [Actinobacteria bacterium]|nr:bifunctional (p)ppGpp synthetase/guanosine-3',5'-bis(diphosphate) 3'-pyrophosphohydrolase [Actinomycetota bacterium]